MEDREVTEQEMSRINSSMLTEMISHIDPDLALIRTYLDYSKINPKIIPLVIDQLHLIAKGSGFGSVIIEIQDGKIVLCRGIDDRHVDFSINREENIE